MFPLLCLTSGFLVCSTALEIPYYNVAQAEQLFEDFILTFGKTYSNQEEKQTRLQIFKDNLQTINEMNLKGGAVFHINHFSDLTREEMKNYMGFKEPSGLFKDDCKVQTDKDVNTKIAPESKDWEADGAVTPVKNQGQCGSCYAFSTIGNIETQYYLKNNELLKFSEQEIVDCSTQNYGCGGGFMAVAMTDLMKLGGVETQENYPYEAEKKTCRYDNSKVKAKLMGCKTYQLSDEDILKQVLANQGPVSIAINADSLGSYHEGIMSEKQCSSTGDLSHAVLLVGYGTDNGIDYWRIKNSWGTNWGELGYFRITRGENTCSLLNKYIASADL